MCVIGRLTTILSVSELQLAPAPFKIVMGTIGIQAKSLHAILIPMLSRVHVLQRPRRRLQLFAADPEKAWLLVHSTEGASVQEKVVCSELVFAGL